MISRIPAIHSGKLGYRIELGVLSNEHLQCVVLEFVARQLPKEFLEIVDIDLIARLAVFHGSVLTGTDKWQRVARKCGGMASDKVVRDAARR